MGETNRRADRARKQAAEDLGDCFYSRQPYV
jgi:hypothetical protein